ncbi:hypothetical protein F4804DRAFT_299575 [Jackrogersella minutella]|nr:hypothetical protein F4804DRAFT_299575 [Jackrogersella minutella]
MATLNPLPAYILGAACFGRGAMAILSPKKEYGNVGLPVESHYKGALPTNQQSASNGGFASPLMYFKGIREISYGVTLMVLQQQGNESAVTTFAAILSLVRFGDGLVVWLNGGGELRWKALGHWITGASFVGWVMRRWR